MKLTRRRGSKHLQARAAGGRYTQPTVLGLTGMDVCGSCRRFYKAVVFSEGPFPEPQRVKVCPHCGSDPNAEPVK